MNKPLPALRIAAGLALLFLHFPLFIIVLYAFTTEDRTYQFPPPGLTFKWFGAAAARSDIWAAMWLSVKVAVMASSIAMLLGTCRRRNVPR